MPAQKRRRDADDERVADDAQNLTVGQILARLAPQFPSLTSSKLRFLEVQGMVTPLRTEDGRRLFRPADAERLQLVLALQRDHYLPLVTIRDYLLEIDAGRDPEAIEGDRQRARELFGPSDSGQPDGREPDERAISPRGARDRDVVREELQLLTLNQKLIELKEVEQDRRARLTRWGIIGAAIVTVAFAVIVFLIFSGIAESANWDWAPIFVLAPTVVGTTVGTLLGFRSLHDNTALLRELRREYAAIRRSHLETEVRAVAAASSSRALP